jgi:hypothetical protein
MATGCNIFSVKGLIGIETPGFQYTVYHRKHRIWAKSLTSMASPPPQLLPFVDQGIVGELA